MRRADPLQSVADSLQADVMRFMAIIAFCLIAILALVRSVAPVEPTDAPVPANAARQAVAEPELAARSETAALPATPPAALPVEQVPAEAPPAPPAVPSAPQPAPDRRPVVDAPAVEAGAQTSTPTPAVPTPAQEEGLSLRFASEQDFLRLVTRGRIQVFAFNGEEVLTIGADLTARPASAPGEVHELLPETIPELMTGALARRHGQGYRWAVAMPDGMARQIRRFVDQGATGELIIDRFGEVRHRDA